MADKDHALEPQGGLWSKSWIRKNVATIGFKWWSILCKSHVLKLFHLRPPKADSNHCLEPWGASNKKVEKKQKFFEFDFMPKCCTQNSDLGTPKTGPFLGPWIKKLCNIKQ